MFREGDIVRARIANVDMEKRRILLTFRDAAEDQILTNKKADKLETDGKVPILLVLSLRINH